MRVVGRTRKLVFYASWLCGERLHLSPSQSYRFNGLEVTALIELFPGSAPVYVEIKSGRIFAPVAVKARRFTT
jgi:hypothetical protein